MILDLLLLPFLACLVLAGIHAYLGLHVLARGVIFVDLALAQTAALGMTVALLAGHAPESDAAYGWALGFTLVGALVFALTRRSAGDGYARSAWRVRIGRRTSKPRSALRSRRCSASSPTSAPAKA